MPDYAWSKTPVNVPFKCSMCNQMALKGQPFGYNNTIETGNKRICARCSNKMIAIGGLLPTANTNTISSYPQKSKDLFKDIREEKNTPNVQSIPSDVLKALEERIAALESLHNMLIDKGFMLLDTTGISPKRKDTWGNPVRIEYYRIGELE